MFVFDAWFWELASYVVTVIGLPLAIVVFISDQRRERRNEEDEVYQLLSDASRRILALVESNYRRSRFRHREDREFLLRQIFCHLRFLLSEQLSNSTETCSYLTSYQLYFILNQRQKQYAKEKIGMHLTKVRTFYTCC